METATNLLPVYNWSACHRRALHIGVHVHCVDERFEQGASDQLEAIRGCVSVIPTLSDASIKQP